MAVAVSVWLVVGDAGLKPTVATGVSLTAVTVIENVVEPIVPPAPSDTVKAKLSAVVSPPLWV